MKTLKHLVILLLLLGSGSLHSQDISINLSIRWSEGPYILKTDSIVKYPELVVSYTNNSEDNLYFRKFSYYRNGFSDFQYYEIPDFNFYNPTEDEDHDYREYCKKHTNYRETIRKVIDNGQYKDEKYYVIIRLPYVIYQDWEAINDNVWDDDEIETDFINKKLMIINDYLSDSIYGIIDDRKQHKDYFSESDITEDAIMDKTNDQFMFLKASESKEDIYNITCFDIVKGTYTFVLDGKKFKDSIFTGWCNGEHLPLPKKVGEYKLYSGEFTSNSVTITFE